MASIPPEVFIIGTRARIFTEQEIAHWVRNNRVGAKQKVELLQAIAAFRGVTSITGILRTALREMEGLPPIPGDEIEPGDEAKDAWGDWQR